MPSRRDFIGKLAITAGVAMAPGCFGITNREQRRLGFIAGIIKKEIEEDWRTALKMASGLSYSEMEISTCPATSVKEFLSFCTDIQLTPVGGGIPMTDDHDTIEKRLDALQEMKMEYAVVYWPWFGDAPFSLDDCKKSAEGLNTLGEATKQRKMSLLWHNHDHEFKPMEAGLPFDYLMTHTDPDLVKCEMDVYWVTKGGADPVALLRKYEGKFTSLHLKDMAKAPSEDFACPGEGRIDFQAIYKEALSQGIGHFFIERDNVEDGMECLRISSDYLTKIKV